MVQSSEFCCLFLFLPSPSYRYYSCKLIPIKKESAASEEISWQVNFVCVWSSVSLMAGLLLSFIFLILSWFLGSFLQNLSILTLSKEFKYFTPILSVMIHTTSIILGPRHYFSIKSIKVCEDMFIRRKCLGVGVINLHLKYLLR